MHIMQSKSILCALYIQLHSIFVSSKNINILSVRIMYINNNCVLCAD